MQISNVERLEFVLQIGTVGIGIGLATQPPPYSNIDKQVNHGAHQCVEEGCFRRTINADGEDGFDQDNLLTLLRNLEAVLKIEIRLSSIFCELGITLLLTTIARKYSILISPLNWLVARPGDIPVCTTIPKR